MHTDFFSESCWIKPNLNCIYSSPTDLAREESAFDQSENCKYNLISVWIYKIQRRFFLCVLCGVETNSGQTRKTIRETGVSRQNGVPNKCAPQTPQFYSVVMVRGVPAGTQLEPLGRSWGFRETPNSRTALQVCRFFPVRI